MHFGSLLGKRLPRFASTPFRPGAACALQFLAIGMGGAGVRVLHLRPGALWLAWLRTQAGRLAVLLLSWARGFTLRPNNSFKPTPLRYGKRAALRSVPPFCLHYAARLNSSVGPHKSQ